MEMKSGTKPRGAKCLVEGVVVNSAGEHVLRFVPPLNVTDEEIDRALAILSDVLGL